MLINLLLVLCLNANHALDESGQVCRRPADGLNNDIYHAPSVFGLLCATACGKKVLFFRSVCSQLICKLRADQGRIALFYNGVHSMDCVRLFLTEHVDPKQYATWDTAFHSMTHRCAFWVNGFSTLGRGPCFLSVKESCMTFVLAYAALYVLLTVTGRVFLRQATVAKSSHSVPSSRDLAWKAKHSFKICPFRSWKGHRFAFSPSFLGSGSGWIVGGCTLASRTRLLFSFSLQFGSVGVAGIYLDCFLSRVHSSVFLRVFRDFFFPFFT